MDTTETYIELCEKAKEIQTESFKCLMPDDFIAHRFLIPEMEGKHLISTIWREEASSLTTEIYSEKYIWLPRQDQLQEMVKETLLAKGKSLIELLYAFNNFLNMGYPTETPTGIHSWLPAIKFTSPEQLWLAFVMKEKYNKVWTNGEWIDA